MTDTPPESPLSVGEPDTISELFSRDPDTWTDGDMIRMVDHLRAKRKELGENQAPPKKASKLPPEVLSGSTADLLSSLGLD